MFFKIDIMARYLDSTGIGHLCKKIKKMMSESIPKATPSTYGGIKTTQHWLDSSLLAQISPARIEFTKGRNYGIYFGGTGQAVVTVPWTDTTYETATTTSDGLMSASDKVKLDGIEEDANNYSLPAASSGVLGGIKTGYSQSGKNYPVKTDTGGNAYVNVPWTDANTTYSVVTTTTAGLAPKLPTGDIVQGKNTITPAMQVLAGDGKWKGMNIGYNPINNSISIGIYDANLGYGNVYATVPVAKETADGLMAKADKKLIDSFRAALDGNNASPFIVTEQGIQGNYHWDSKNNQMSFSTQEMYGVYYGGEDKWDYGDNIFSLPDIPAATQTSGGVMTNSDKMKLDSVDTSVLPYMIDLGSSSPFDVMTWVDLNKDVYKKLYDKAFTQPVYLRARIGYDNWISPAIVDAAGNSKIFITFFNALGDPYRLTVTLNLSSEATGVVMQNASHTWKLVEEY